MVNNSNNILNYQFKACYYEGSPRSYDLLLEYINIGFAVVFLIEAIFKIIALTPKGYFIDPWNKLDFFVVLTAFFDLFLLIVQIDNILIY